ncbi:hypothetical protein [Nonomuraea soli]|uniref:Uncharacterized protein n=1 Tax=Nonomuraea soli TaxID=1032476 RepID=A0A7W0CHS4_9ACTN|nr:hypothetical protein [Nonomuraea soli]MBA2891433.1 hypothetical protein [Nonomuraea soli]
MKRMKKSQAEPKPPGQGLVPTPHEGVTAVHLRPSVLLADDNARVWRVQISPSPRTPSPFGSRMGDHTIAWAVHLDVIKAEMYGKTPAEAYAWLKEAHQSAVRWMPDVDSDDTKRLRWLADSDARAVRLEDSAYLAKQWLDKADESVRLGRPAEIAERLGPAIAHHLAYVNYLPFSTVRNLKDRSTGSAEGRYRKIVLECERHFAKQAEMEVVADTPSVAKPVLARTDTEVIARPEPEPEPVKAPDPAQVRDALWRLFSFDAALRETAVVYALSKQAANQPRVDTKEVEKLAIQLTKHLKQRKSFVLKPTQIKEEAERLATRLYDSKPQQYLWKAANTIKNVADQLVLILGDPTRVEGYRKDIADYLVLAKAETQGETNKATDASERFAKIMSHLLHEHQRLCAIAYPQSVRMSGFLDPTPAEAAITRLRAEMLKLHPKQAAALAGAPGTKLFEALKKELEKDTLPAIPDVGADVIKGWVSDDTGDPLVVTFTAGTGIDVNGRPPAPAGVAGMGCHTSAWVIQSTAVKKAMRVASDEDGLDKIEELVEQDLAAEIIKLDRYLPLAQLQGGQLKTMFQAAFDALTDATSGESAGSYLTFRNMLPFATVDAGNRAGHGEGLDATVDKTFDRSALNKTLELLADERRDLPLEFAKTLRAVAVDLEDELTFKGDDRWSADFRIKAAVEDSVDRLREEADLLELGGPAADVSSTIRDTRWAEHQRLYIEAHQL